MRKFIGSAAENSLGVGTLLVGDEWRRSEEGFELHCREHGWIAVYDVAEVSGYEPVEWQDPPVAIWTLDETMDALKKLGIEL